MNKLNFLCADEHLSQLKVSKYSGIAHSTICNLIAEKRAFRQVHIDALTSFFGVTTDYLLGNSDYGYIVHTQYGDETITLSAREYFRLRDRIKVTLVENTTTISVITKSKKREETFRQPKYTLYRELQGTLKDYDSQGLLIKKLMDLTNRLDTDELQKTISFIETYILK